MVKNWSMWHKGRRQDCIWVKKLTQDEIRLPSRKERHLNWNLKGKLRWINCTKEQACQKPHSMYREYHVQSIKYLSYGQQNRTSLNLCCLLEPLCIWAACFLHLTVRSPSLETLYCMLILLRDLDLSWLNNNILYCGIPSLISGLSKLTHKMKWRIQDTLT